MGIEETFKKGLESKLSAEELQEYYNSIDALKDNPSKENYDLLQEINAMRKEMELKSGDRVTRDIEKWIDEDGGLLSSKQEAYPPEENVIWKKPQE